MEYITCPFCGEDDGEPEIRDQRGFYDPGILRTFFRCRNCSTLYPKPRWGYDDLIERETRFSLNRHPTSLGSRDAGPFSRTGFVLALLKRYRKTCGIRRALDVGANTGAFCHLLGLLGIEAYGIEPQAEAVAVARGAGLRVYHGFFPGSMPRELLTEPYQMVSLNEVVYYFQDIRKALDATRDILSAGGIVFMKIRNGESYLREPGTNYFQWYGDAVQAVPTVPSARTWLEESGFTVKETVPYPDDYFTILTGERLRFVPPVLRSAFNAAYGRLTLRPEDWALRVRNAILIAAKG